MVQVKRERIAETLKQPSLCLRLGAPDFYPDFPIPDPHYMPFPKQS